MTVALIQQMGLSISHLAGGITRAGLLYPGTSPLTCSLPQHQTPVAQSIWIATLDLVQVNKHTSTLSGYNSDQNLLIELQLTLCKKTWLNINHTRFTSVYLHCVTWH